MTFFAFGIVYSNLISLTVNLYCLVESFYFHMFVKYSFKAICNINNRMCFIINLLKIYTYMVHMYNVHSILPLCDVEPTENNDLLVAAGNT